MYHEFNFIQQNSNFLVFLDIVKPRNSVQSQRKAYITREVMRIAQKQQIQKSTIIS